MRIVAGKNILAYAEKHPVTEPSCNYWLKTASSADWRTMNEISMSFRNCKVLNGERIRFEVAGGGHRMIVALSFPGRACWIKFLGTHKEYDAIDALAVAMF